MGVELKIQGKKLNIFRFTNDIMLSTKIEKNVQNIQTTMNIIF